jgi:hypothetical protein
MHHENPFCMVKPVARALPLHKKRRATCLLRIVARRYTLEKRAMQPIHASTARCAYAAIVYRIR